MKQLPPVDPPRPLQRAILECKSLGGLCLVWSLIAVLIPGNTAPPTTGAALLAALRRGWPSALLPLGAAVALYAVAGGLKRRREWAVIVVLIGASVVALFAWAGMVMIAWMIFGTPPTPGPMRVGSFVALLIGTAIALMVTRLVWDAATSFKAIRYLPPEEQRGFEVIASAPQTSQRRDSDREK